MTEKNDPRDGESASGAVAKAVDKALSAQAPAVDAYVAKLRGWTSAPDGGKPKGAKRGGSPQAALRAAERQYLAAVTSMGAGVGAAAAAPGVGTAIAVSASALETAANIDATALFVMTCANIYGVDVADLERRRLLFYAVMLGNSGAKVVETVAGRTGPHWARGAVNAISLDTIRAINKVLGRNFVTRYGTRQGVLVLGRVAPFGIGAAIGGGGNAALGQMTIRAARKAFGPPPENWPDTGKNAREPQ